MGWCFQRPKDNVENASLPGLWSSSADRTWRTWLYKSNRFNMAHMCVKGRGVSHMWERLKYSTTLLPWRHMGEVSFAHMLPHRLLCGSASLLLTVPQWNITRHEHRFWSCRHRHANQGFSCSVENDEYIYIHTSYYASAVVARHSAVNLPFARDPFCHRSHADFYLRYY